MNNSHIAQPEWIQKFIEVHPPLQTQAAEPDLCIKYSSVLPADLLQLWTEYGLGVYGNGFLQIINPDAYRQILNDWLLREDDGTRIPFAITAFGEIFYWRVIYNASAQDDASSYVYDVSYLNPHDSTSDLCCYTMEQFLGDFIVDAGNIGFYKWDYSIADDQDEAANTTLFERALAKFGALTIDEMYSFVPALRLGGLDDVEHISKASAPVHLDILLQIANDESSVDTASDYLGYDDDFIDALRTPADYDAKIESIKNTINGTDDAEKYYKIGKLLQNYPTYDPSLKNPDEVSKRTTQLARENMRRAIELAPAVPKYYYAAVQFDLYHYNQHTDWKSTDDLLEKFYELTGEEEVYLHNKIQIADNTKDEDTLIQASERLYKLTGNINDFSNAAFYYEKNQDYEKALQLNRRIFDESDQFSTARGAARSMAAVYLKQRKEAEANEVFDALIRRFPDYEAQALKEKSGTIHSDFYSKGSVEKALAVALQAAEKIPATTTLNEWERADFYYMISNLYEELSEFENALIYIEKAIEESPESYYLNKKSGLLFKMNRTDEAQAVTDAAEYPSEDQEKRNDPANWQNIINSLQNSAKAYDNRIDQLEAELEEDEDDAVKQFLLGKLYENYPTYSLPADEQENQAELSANGAFVAYCAATDLDEENAEYQLAMADFLYFHHYNLEIEDDTRDELMRNGYEFWIEHGDDPYKGYEGLKRMAQYIDDYEDIIHYAQLCYDEKPKETYNLIEIAAAYRELQKYPEAIQYYQEYLQAVDDFSMQLTAKQGLMETYIKSGDAGRARHLASEMDKAATDDYQRYELYSQAANAFLWSDDKQSALEYQKIAVQHAERSGDRQYAYPSALLELSSQYEQLSDMKTAIELARKVCSLRIESYDWSRLAFLLKEDGQISEARKAVQEAIRLDPDDSWALEVQEDIGDEPKSGFFGKLFGK